jgi:OOP family OmpA-OmpF porin
MRDRPGRARVVAFLLLACVAAAAPALAQTAAPTSDQMIDALKPRTRSLRNLVVGDAPASAASDAAPAGAPPTSTSTSTAPASAAASPENASTRPALSMAIRFDFDSAHLRPEGAAVLERLALALRSPALHASRFLIAGHTDAQGAAAYNLRLSQQRADEVQRFLAAHGVAADRLSARGRGAEEPVNPDAPLAPENRRVRIVNLDAD